MIKTTAITITLILTSCISFSQSFQKQFDELSKKKDFEGQEKVLANWKTTNPKDPELFIAYFNHYINKSRSEVIILDTQQKNNEALELIDTTAGMPVAYLSSAVDYNQNNLQKGFKYIDQGIALYPNRLDMRFGKIYMLGEVENYTEFTKEIMETLAYDHKLKNAWLWKEGKQVEDPKEFLLGSIQSYVNTIYNTEDDNLLPLIRQISETVIKYYPDHVESLSNIAVTYVINGEYDKALPLLLKAESLAPKDAIVLNNIAEAYKNKGDKENARLYFEKVIKYGNAEEVQDARSKIKRL